MKRLLVACCLALGAAMAYAAPVATDLVPQALTAVQASVKAEMPQPNFTIISSAEKANHATASASEARMPGDPDYNGPVMSLSELRLDTVTGFPSANLGGTDPGDNEGGGIGSDSLALRDPGTDDDSGGSETTSEGLTG